MTRKCAVITGASAGLGELFARRLAPEYDLLLVSRRRDRLDRLAEELEKSSGCRVGVLGADLTDPSGLSSAVDRVQREERLAILVNNAGYGKKGLFWESPVEEEIRMHELHVTATIRLTHAALRIMVPRADGAVINVASVAAFARAAGSTSYSATKAWMVAFSEGLQLELHAAQSPVTVQALCPGFTYSEFHDVMKADRRSLAPAFFWLKAADVVDASLAGVRRGARLVIPSRRYRYLTAVYTRLPFAIRMAFAAKRPRSRPSAE